MNFLQLAQRLGREVGTNNVPSTVVSQTGEMRRLCDWINLAWQDLQIARPNWYWMRSTFTLPTVAGDSEYTSTDAGITTRFGAWDADSLRIYKVSTGDEIALPYISYNDFRYAYLTGSRPQARPVCFTVGPALQLMLGNTPDDVYTITGDYYKAPQELALDADIPEMPEQYHMAIVYRAMMLYARFEAAAEIYQDADANYRRFIKRIELNQLPERTLPEPLV